MRGPEDRGDIEEHLRELIRAEGLDNLPRLLALRTWDEVPIASRYAHLAFLCGLAGREKTRILTLFALRQLDLMRAFLAAESRPGFLAVTLCGWPELDSSDEEPLIPSFFMSFDPRTELAQLRFEAADRWERQLVVAWISGENPTSAHLVLVPKVVESTKEDPSLFRIYLVHREDLQVAGDIYRPLSSGSSPLFE